MDFLIHVHFFCTAAAAAAVIFDGLFVNIEFREHISHFVQILLVVCQNCLNQLDVNKPHHAERLVNPKVRALKKGY
jgi:hypothetical protein